MGCQNCEKEGLPIFPVRYAVFNAPFCNPPKLSGNFYINEPGRAPAPQSAQNIVSRGGPAYVPPQDIDIEYTTRVLRNGFLYVMTQFDSGQENWDCYQVFEGNYLLLYNIPLAKNVSENEIRAMLKSGNLSIDASCDDEACKSASNKISLSFISIKSQITAKNKAKIARLSFSDTYWTYRTFKKHIDDRDGVQQHMREIKVKEWINSGQEQNHTGHIDKLQDIVAEYSPAMQDARSRMYMRLSADENAMKLAGLHYNPQGADKNLEDDGLDYFDYKMMPKVKKMITRTTKPVTKFPAKYQTQVTLRKDYDSEIPTKVAEKALAISSDAGLKNNGLIVALDDPVGIIQYLNKLTAWKIGHFSSDMANDQRARKLFAARGIAGLRNMVKSETIRNETSKRRNAYVSGRIVVPIAKTRSKNEVDKVVSKTMNDFDANYNWTAVNDFMLKFDKELTEYKQTDAEPLAQKMFNWFKMSEITKNYFNDNFDDGEGSKDDDAVQSGSDFACLVASCLDDVQAVSVTATLYCEDWLSADAYSADNYLIRGFTLNLKAHQALVSESLELLRESLHVINSGNIKDDLNNSTSIPIKVLPATTLASSVYELLSKRGKGNDTPLALLALSTSRAQIRALENAKSHIPLLFMNVLCGQRIGVISVDSIEVTERLVQEWAAEDSNSRDIKKEQQASDKNLAQAEQEYNESKRKFDERKAKEIGLNDELRLKQEKINQLEENRSRAETDQERLKIGKEKATVATEAVFIGHELETVSRQTLTAEFELQKAQTNLENARRQHGRATDNTTGAVKEYIKAKHNSSEMFTLLTPSEAKAAAAGNLDLTDVKIFSSKDRLDGFVNDAHWGYAIGVAGGIFSIYNICVAVSDAQNASQEELFYSQSMIAAAVSDLSGGVLDTIGQLMKKKSYLIGQPQLAIVKRQNAMAVIKISKYFGTAGSLIMALLDFRQAYLHYDDKALYRLYVTSGVLGLICCGMIIWAGAAISVYGGPIIFILVLSVQFAIADRKETIKNQRITAWLQNCIFGVNNDGKLYGSAFEELDAFELIFK